jgi:hypothetical protein
MRESLATVLARGAKNGSAADVDRIMDILRMDRSLVEIKAADFALDFVTADEGVDRIRRYLAEGSGMQRNYCANYFRRRGERQPLLEAWEQGLIDDIQAFCR